MYVLELAGTDDAFAAAEAERAATDVNVVAPGLATARGVERAPARALAYTHRVSRLVGHTEATVGHARALLDGAAIDREGTVAVRARDVRGTTGVDTRAVERELGAVLTDRGFAVDLDDPDHELRALYSDGVCYVGWLELETVRDYGDRAPTDRPFFQPGSMDTLLARAVVNLAGARPGATLLDPMCGTGGLLLEAGLVGAGRGSADGASGRGARVVGADAQWKMVRGARENLAHYLPGGDWEVLRGDATALPVRDGGVDAVVFDAPYGRQSKIAHRSLDDLVGGALAEARRVAPRAVVVADRRWDDAAEAAGWTVADVFERRVHRSLDRYVHVLD